MGPLIIIKLGGSVITYKNSSLPKPRKDNISRLAREIAGLYKTGNYKIVLVHGAGSFGHPIVKKYGLHKGMKTTQQKLAYAKTAQSMLDLNEFIVKSLIRQSVPAVSFPPHSFATQRAGKFKGFNHDVVGKCLEEGQVPVLFGDGVLDDEWGCSILSGDTIVSYLAKKLKVNKVVFLSDVDGIFEQDPKTNPQAKLIPEVNNRNLNQALSVLKCRSSSDTNVTGEMYGKMMAIKKELRKKGVYIINGLQQGVLTRILAGEKIGTKIYFT